MSNFDQTHADFDAHKDRYALSAKLYEGGSKVEKGSFLIQHSWEPDTQFSKRNERAVYSNFAAPIVDIFGASICENRPGATLSTQVEAMQKNVDRQGKSREAFFQEVVTLAAAHGLRYVLVDHPEAGATGSSLTPYFVQVDALNVIDWRVGADGELDWAVVKVSVEKDREPFSPPEIVTRHTVWTREAWTQYEDEKKVAEGKHGLGLVPLVPFQFEASGPMTGLSAIDEVTSLLIRIFRRDSELDMQLFNAAVALMVAAGVDKDIMEAFVKASWNCLTVPPDAKVQYVETSGSSFEALVQAMDRDISRVREIALRTVRPVSGVGESAEAKKLDNKQLDCQLAKFARQCKAAEERCWKIACKWLKAGEGEKIETPYNEKFDVASIDTELTDFLLELRKNSDISRGALLKHPEVKKALPKDFDPVDDAAALEKEAQGTPGPTGAGATGLGDLARRFLGEKSTQDQSGAAQ